MFHKDGSSTSGGKKDVPLRKSDRRRLRDRVVDSLFIGSNPNDNEVAAAVWIARAEQLIDDAIIAPRGGDVLSRKLKLSSGIYATLFLRTPCLDSSSATDATTTPVPVPPSSLLSMDEVLNTGFPTTWPYYSTTQPILLEYEDEDRKVQLIPLLPLLAALPPPILSSPPNASTSSASSSTIDSEDEKRRQYRIPNILIHPEVSKFICRGADLMKSGMRSFPPPWTLRQSKGIVTISVIGNPQPVAVGTIEKSLFREYCYSKSSRDWKEDATNLIGPGKKGVGVTIVNCYGDDLWKSSLPSKTGSVCNHSVSTKGGATVGNTIGGGFYDDGNFGNHGFVDGKYVNPILDVVVDSDSDTEENWDDDNGAADMEQLKLSEPCKNEGTSASDDAEISTTDNEESNNNNNEEDRQTEQDGEEDSVPDHNDILLNACYTSLILLLSSKAPLPIPVSTYYAKNLLAAVPATGPKLDMKQTTYKKIGPFLKDIEAIGVIKLGASKDGKDRCAFLTGIVKDHHELIRFKRQWKKDIAASGGDVSAMTSASSSQESKLAIVDLFIVPKTVSETLHLDKEAVMAADAKTDERKGTGFLTKTECRALIENYIETENLVDPKSKGRVLVNGPLCDALYRTSKKNMQPGQPTELPTSVVRKDLIDTWMKRMDCGHALVQMPGSKILHLKRGQPTPVDIEVEFRQGNRRKFLTRIRGMEEYGVEGESLSQDVSHRFACSATIETAPVGRPALKKGRVELVFQGHLSEELTALLSGDEKLTCHGGVKGGEYNVPKSVINVVLRKGVPAKKKR